MTAEADKPTDQEAGEPVVTSTARTSSPTQSMKFIRHRSFSEGALSLFQIQATSTVMESVSDQAHLPVQVVEQVQDSPEDGGGHYYHHHGISMDHNREQMATSADEHPVAGKPTAGTPSSTPLVPTLNLPSSTEASTASEGLGGENMQTLTLVTAVEPATVAVVVEEESAVSWIWRWGTLPKKTKPKSTTDLENLHTVAAMDPSNSKGTGQTAVVESSNIAPDARDSVLPQDSSADKKFSTSKAAAGKGRGRAVNVRHRAVSLPVLRQYEFMTEPTSTAGARQVEGYRALIPPELQDTADADSDDSNKDGRSNTVFTQLVTAIESDIAPGSPYKDKSIPDLGANAGAFSSMLAAARVDNSRFHALSLCGQLLTSPSDPLSDPSIDAAVPSNAAELRQLLEAHLISPHDIVQSESPILSGECKDTDTLQEVEERGSVCPSILSSPHLVVILDDFLLPLRAAEKLLQKICAMDRNMSGDGSESHTQTQGIVDPPSYTISEQEVRDVLRELESDLHREHAGQVVLPQWAGKRISLWGRGFESLEGAQIIFTDPPHGTPTMLDPAALVSADEIHSTAEEEEVVERDTGNTPLGHLSWQQSFSDLVQAYRVHNIHTIHSYLDLSARAHRFGDTYNEISDDGSGGGGVSSYTERWNRLQSSPGTSGSFTALLALDTRTIHRLYTSEQDLDKWAVGVGLCRTRTHSECNSRAVSHDAYDQDHPSASRGLSLSRDDGNDHVQVNKITTTSHHHHTVHSTLHIHHHHHQQQQQQQDESADHDYGVGEGYSFMSHSDNDNDGALRSAAGSHNSLPTLEEIVVDIDLEIDVDADVDAELIDGGVGASVEVKGEVTAFLAEGDEPIGVAVADVFVEDTVTAESATAAATEGDKDEPLRRPAPSTQQQQHYQQQNNYLHPLEDTNSTTDGAETDNDCLSLQDIDFEDISPEPATGDFYESDTDSYLSLSLEEGESGRYTNNNNNNSSRRNSMRNNTFSLGDTDQTAATAANNNDNTSAHEIQVGRRRIKRYLYRKVLVPSAEQLTALPLQDGVNEVGFELPGCNPLRSCLYLWPSDCRIVVTDIEGVFTHASAHHNPMNSTATVWMQFLGGGGTLNSRSVANKKAYFDEAIRLFRALHQQGYRILYIAQTSTNTTTSNSNSNTLLSSQEYLQRIKTSTGECLPPGPIFKSPDSLIRAFGASRTDVFKAGALKGVKSLFPSSHNPYHACFCIRESDSIPFARFGFPEGRIFLVSEKGDVKSANRTCNFTFPRLSELLHQIFPHVVGKYGFFFRRL